MKEKSFNRSSLKISKLVFGGNVFGWTVNCKSSFDILDSLLDFGINCIDTADIYSYWVSGNHGGESETIIGKWIKKSKKRDQIILATKVGKGIIENGKRLSSQCIYKSIHHSLRRLQTDYIDLYQSHLDDPHVPLEETLSTFDNLVKEGKVRSIGASNYSKDRLIKSINISKSNNLAHYEFLQPLYNLYDRKSFEENLLSTVIKYKIRVINYYSLASGFLSGKYRSHQDEKKSVRGSLVVQRYLNERGLKILSALDRLSKIYNATPSQISLAWQMQHPGITAPIVSATSVVQLQELVGSMHLKLQEKDFLFLDKISEE